MADELPAEILRLAASPMGNPEVIGLLEKMLAEAKAGRMIAVGIVHVAAPHQVGAMTAGPALMEIYTGAGVLAKTSLDAMTGPAAAQQRSGLLVPRRV